MKRVVHGYEMKSSVAKGNISIYVNSTNLRLKLLKYTLRNNKEISCFDCTQLQNYTLILLIYHVKCIVLYYTMVALL